MIRGVSSVKRRTSYENDGCGCMILVEFLFVCGKGDHRPDWMVCCWHDENRAENSAHSTSDGEGQVKSLKRGKDNKLGVKCPSKHRRVKAVAGMMVDSGRAVNPRAASHLLPEKDQVGDGGYATGGWRSDDGKLNCGYSSFRGKRVNMEDFFDVKSAKIDGQTINFFGIFDGHGGSRAAEYLKEHLFDNLMKHPKFLTDIKLAINESYQRTDSDFLDAENNTSRDDGSTASTAILVGKHLYVANVGDSRAVISKAGKAIPLSDDHKPNRIDERRRIENAGGFVMWTGTWRVGGVLAMSRAFGNRLLKRFVVAEPDIQERVVDHELEFLILASDGLWDVVKNEDAVSLVRLEEDPEAAARKLTEVAFSRGSADNITCIVVRFLNNKEGVGPPPACVYD
ncbi:hypothetical protein C4D60_Mb08t28140 [Musa balbisiana]|uniref:protein-serine/threonine phosphatase n=1 Tax=Musa balbisiana TaxID=52838 RepID=A0A4S8K723_MUSBA|nr:hypothetical protein C4D60_Mb08t28140 [Musa balbisiana]